MNVATQWLLALAGKIGPHEGGGLFAALATPLDWRMIAPRWRSHRKRARERRRANRERRAARQRRGA